jgi:hypothetical protein
MEFFSSEGSPGITNNFFKLKNIYIIKKYVPC